MGNEAFILIAVIGIGVIILVLSQQKPEKRKRPVKNPEKVDDVYAGTKLKEEPLVVTSPKYQEPISIPETPPTKPSMRWVTSVPIEDPRPEVLTRWNKIGILTLGDSEPLPGGPPGTDHHRKEEIMNLYSKSIAPLQGAFEYQAEDKNGFLIPVRVPKWGTFEDGDVIKHIEGKGGPWKVVLYSKYKFAFQL